MFIDFETFKARADKLQALMAEAARAAGRDPAEVRLLPVTKTHPAAAADYVARYGLPAVGENRVQEAVAKRAEVAAPLHWELIGHLQSNKAALAAQHFDRIQSVDREKLLHPLDRAAGELGRPLSVLLQVNAGHDPAKFGAEPADAPRLLDAALAKANLRVEGFMTIAPLGTTPAETAEHARRTFANLRAIRDDLAARTGVPLRELSMGMSGDFALAIAAGSTLVRVGTALFGARE
ncbi:YggS family pyridoxal phosphate-dependent enzyme [Oleiharenicola sp. Vm1]|uniref:YggS family pyridoxal phosphate-dependent enzyme n=1 Tax=Oleiharenicola sp. Vm1 TaxID=3398393 RepID=UPI0039F4B958